MSEHESGRVVTRQCPGCRAKLRFAAELVGKSIRCPRCTGILRIRARAGAAGKAGVDSSAVADSGRTAEGPVPGELPAGRTLGPYRLIGRLGRGARGTVYEAEEAITARRVAVKVLTAGSAEEGAELMRRFVVEAKAASRIDHPNVVGVYGAGEDQGLIYIAMSLVRGGSTAQRLRRDGPFPPAEATRIIRASALGLARAHSMGIIHRDVKPANILLGESGEVKLADFGMAKITDDAVAGLTEPGAMLGTAHYMSPEQCLGRKIDHRADLYSLGASYYCLLAGRPPFTDMNPVAVAHRQITEPHPDPRTFDPDIPEACIAVIDRAMAKKPDERYQSALEMADALHAVQQFVQRTEGKASAARMDSESLHFELADNASGETVVGFGAELSVEEDREAGSSAVVKPLEGRKSASKSGHVDPEWLKLPSEITVKLKFQNVPEAERCLAAVNPNVREIARSVISPTLLAGNKVALLDFTVCLAPRDVLRLVTGLLEYGGAEFLAVKAADDAVADWLKKAIRLARASAESS